jgi:hypothetical protein
MKTLTTNQIINKGFISTMKIVNGIEDAHVKNMCLIMTNHFYDIMKIDSPDEPEIEIEEKEAFDWTEDQRKDFNNDLKFAEHRENS